ncbi:hypothetical protein L3X38_003938 [Prunus dulcis]|uniref:Uncharacterized protein n=1 Tax=Prunus dulcis TaxID=3755 RepID=A0AAD5F2M5_PRUDU|nr:hypothetical protein L3X38_003938 [Prunus dulcis]
MSPLELILEDQGTFAWAGLCSWNPFVQKIPLRTQYLPSPYAKGPRIKRGLLLISYSAPSCALDCSSAVVGQIQIDTVPRLGTLDPDRNS